MEKKGRAEMRGMKAEEFKERGGEEEKKKARGRCGKSGEQRERDEKVKVESSSWPRGRQRAVAMATCYPRPSSAAARRSFRQPLRSSAADTLGSDVTLIRGQRRALNGPEAGAEVRKRKSRT